MPVHMLKLTKLTPLCDSVFRLDLQTVDAPMRYREGQFLSIRLPDGQLRSYSMASPDRGDGRIELHIRLLPGGQFSEWLRGTAKAGQVLQAYGPFGDCIWRTPSRATTRIVMLATGTGIAPVKALLEKALSQGVTQSISLYWGGSLESDLYQAGHFAALADQHENFTFIPVLTDADGSWQGRRGFVQAAAAEDHPHLADATVYACGSPLMVNAACELLTTTCGLAPDNFLADAFNPAAATSAPLSQAPDVQLDLAHPDGTRSAITVPADGSLMQALAGAHLMQGVCGGNASCGTCRITVATDWINRLAPPDRTERRLLAALDGTQPTDRLACQIPLQPELHGLIIRLQS
ncbi:FAD-binding oxidoreductase [Andreprevotia chitinilytica]|uniref:FAD-binding oxidoreductase n=1 Tax=Andreprevotia chitinilytica TaxID=396808 RepID=UPI0014700B77|nr:FAD-binding oxidoreductase [Andreprevotia chitinilytica]